MKRYPFNTAYSQARELYGLELTPDEFENIGLIAWDKIGNKDFRWYLYEAVPTKNSLGEWVIELPCNADILEAVTADYEDYQKTSATNLSGNIQSGWVEGYIESRKFNTGFGYISGKYIKYNRVDNTLYLADKFDKVKILYKGVLVDEVGLPFLNEKEMDAVAAYCAYVNDYKQARLTKDQFTFQLSQVSEQKWKSLCTQARVADYINQNEMDEILNVATSWDRKRFGKSFKPIH